MKHFPITRHTLRLDEDQVFKFHRKALFKSLMFAYAISAVLIVILYGVLYLILKHL